MADVTLPRDVVRALYAVYDTWWNKVGMTDPGRRLVSDGVTLLDVAGVISIEDDQAMDDACLTVDRHIDVIKEALGER